MERSSTTPRSEPRRGSSIGTPCGIAMAAAALLATACVKDEPHPTAGVADHGVLVLPNSLVVDARPGDIRAVNGDGKVVWSLKLDAPETVLGKLAAAPNSTVYVRTTLNLRALSPDGAWLWKVPLTTDADDKDPLAYSPAAMTDSAPVVLVGGQKYRSYTLSGEVRWELGLDAGEHPRLPPQVAPDGRIYLSTDQSLYAVRPNGKLSWRLAR